MFYGIVTPSFWHWLVRVKPWMHGCSCHEPDLCVVHALLESTLAPVQHPNGAKDAKSSWGCTLGFYNAVCSGEGKTTMKYLSCVS